MSIMLAVWLCGVLLAAGVLFAATQWQRFEKIGSEMALGLLIASLPFLFAGFANIYLMVAAALVHIWLLALPGRHLMGRLEPLFLHYSTRLNTILGILTLILCSILQATGLLPPLHLITSVVLVGTISTAVFFLGQLLWNMRHYRFTLPQKLPLKEYPTVSVCIPARNEDHALSECLQTVLASDYPKLEVIVLDDCSQDSTSSIIRSFAHEGVRFIQGQAPASGWLGKNQAMQTLAAHASGDYVLFLDVDTHLKTDSITGLIQYAREQNKEMISVLPRNRLGVTPATVGNTLEQYWRLTLPITSRRMPVASNCWLIRASTLRHLGGFSSVSRKIVPEESFARRLATRDAYRFLVSNPALGVTTAKHWASQAATSLRLSYPRLRRQPMAVLAICAAVLGIYIVPLAVVAMGIAGQDYGAIFWMGVAAYALLLVGYLAVLVRTQPGSWLVAALLLPYVAIQECVIIVMSMVQYEFGEVNWKGRNVCYPVLSPRPLRQQQSHRQSQTV